MESKYLEGGRAVGYAQVGLQEDCSGAADHGTMHCTNSWYEKRPQADEAADRLAQVTNKSCQ